MRGKPGIFAPPVAVAFLAAVAYLSALPNDFVWDDSRAVSRNYLIKRVGHIPLLFVSDLYAGTGQSTGAYRPLLMTTFAIDYALFGPRPWGFRAVNVALHAAASLLVYLVLRRLLGGTWEVPFAAAALFAAHPIHTEAVTMVMGRGEPLSACLILGAWLICLRGGRWALPWSLLLYFLALFAKETAAAFPFLLAAGALFQGAPKRKVLRDFLLGLAVFAAYVPIRLFALGGFVAPEEQILMRGQGLFERLTVMLPVFKEYVLLILFPVKQSLDYQFLARPGAFSMADSIAGAILLVGVLKLTFDFWIKRSPYALGFLLFLIPLLPVSNVFPLGEIMGERLLYLPSIGFCLIFALIVSRVSRPVGWGALIAAVTCCSVLTVTQNRHLRDRPTAAIHMLRHYPRSYKAHAEIGNHFARTGEIGRARAHYTTALNLRGEFRIPRIGLGNLLRDEGELGKAEEHFRALMDEYPNSPEVVYGLGEILLLRGEQEDAKERFEAALTLRESDPFPRMNLGVMAYQEGDREGALRLFREVLDYHPDHSPTLERLAGILAESGEHEAALDAVKKAIRWGTPTSVTWALLGECEMVAGDPREAIEAFFRALELDPDRRDVWINLGLLFLDLRRHAAAEEVFRGLRDRDAKDSIPIFHHATALQQLGRFEEAALAYRKFLDLYEGRDDEYTEQAERMLEVLEGNVGQE